MGALWRRGRPDHLRLRLHDPNEPPLHPSAPCEAGATLTFYQTEPEPNLNHRRLHTPRGKVLGGSSSINGLVYVRGNPLDFESWHAAGARGWGWGWGWQDVLPYFRRAETRAEGGDAYRGDAGPLHTEYGPLRNPLYCTWIEAGKQAGYPETADCNGFQQEGFGRMDMTVQRSRRCSTAVAYLKPAIQRKNLEVRTHALAYKVELEGGRATRLRYRTKGHDVVVHARREVIREIFAQPAFTPYRGEELQPGGYVTTDAEIDTFLRDRVESAYHPCGTCRMGRGDDPMAVVGEDTCVIGIDGLRVVDSSIMPSITTGNLNAPTIMIGEKASDHILDRPKLPPSNQAYYLATNWATAQR
jgi:choline dehydrogenase-like flavoprotein